MPISSHLQGMFTFYMSAGRSFVEHTRPPTVPSPNLIIIILSVDMPSPMRSRLAPAMLRGELSIFLLSRFAISREVMSGEFSRFNECQTRWHLP